ncbi:MAG: sugar-binding domain-containing protein [Negativicutes bacterium]|jgi:beta-galactosidase/beta-glucuronidase
MKTTIPRPEYPRPQLVRQDWLCINGEWDFAFDDDERGWLDSWYRTMPEDTRKIIVPYPFQSRLSLINDQSFHDVVWYWREVEIPPSWDGSYVVLHFGAVDYFAKIYINGHLAGEHTGGHTPFSVDISSFIDEDGYIFIAVCAEDSSEDRTILRGKQYWQEQPEGIFHTRTTGIWQSVWLEPLREAHVEELRWTANIDENSVQLDAELSNHAAGASLEIIIKYHNEIVAKDTIAADGRLLRVTVDFEDFDSKKCLWSPEQPNLFTAEIRMYSGGLFTDAIQSYFGMRKFHAEQGMIFLNNRPYFPKLVLDQGYWPTGLLTAPEDLDYVKDIELAKTLGFNGARKHQKVEDPRYLYWADKIGFIVWGEMANAHEFSPDMSYRLMIEWANVLRRDYNHPCIMAWVPLNASRGVPLIGVDDEQQSLSLSLYMMTKTLDTTRFVISNDGWEHTSSDILGVHNYHTAETLRKNYRTRLCALRAKPAGKKMYVQGYKYGKQPIMLTEFGGKENVAKALVEDYRSLTQALFDSPVVAGFCYTQLYDVEQETNGLLTYDRKPKCDMRAIKKINTHK